MNDKIIDLLFIYLLKNCSSVYIKVSQFIQTTDKNKYKVAVTYTLQLHVYGCYVKI